MLTPHACLGGLTVTPSDFVINTTKFAVASHYPILNSHNSCFPCNNSAVSTMTSFPAAVAAAVEDRHDGSIFPFGKSSQKESPKTPSELDPPWRHGVRALGAARACALLT